MSILVDEIAVRRNSGATVGTRRRLNFLEGANITLTVADDAVDQEVDVTIEAIAGGGGGIAPTTYTIYKSGVTYYAVHGLTGASYNNSNFAALINARMATNTTFTLKAAQYTLDDPIVVNANYVAFVGETQGLGTEIYCTTSDAYFDLHVAGSDIDYVTFKNLYFHGTSTSISCITSQNQASGDKTKGVLIENCVFRYFTAANNRIVYLRNAEMPEIRNNHFGTWTTTANTGGNMIYFDELGYDSGNCNVYDNEFYNQMPASNCIHIVGVTGQTFEGYCTWGNHFYGTGTGSDLSYAHRVVLGGRVGGFRSVSDRTEGINFLTVSGTSTSYGWAIMACNINGHSDATHPDIDINATGCRGMRIIGNYFIFGNGNYVIYDGNTDSSNPTLICDNNFRISSASPVFTINPNSATVIYGNTGTTGYTGSYIHTENGGSSTIASGSTSVVVTHDCDYTPTASDIWITPTANTTTDPGNLWVDTIGAASFTVHCRTNPGAGGMPFRWQVRKSP
jgi:hypothetical protein